MQRSINAQTAALILSARQRLGLNQAEFAKKIGKSQAVVSRYEKGFVAPPGDVVLRCVHILGDPSLERAARMGAWDEALRALEAAAVLVKALRDASADLALHDTNNDNSQRPRPA